MSADAAEHVFLLSRASMAMRGVRLRELQARNVERAAAAGQDYESLLADVRRAYKSGTPGQ
jgi:hypothetical protein